MSKLEEERKEIDGLIIALSIAIVGSSFIIPTSQSVVPFALRSATIASLVTSILLSFWYRYRIALRKTMFDGAQEKWLKEIKDGIDSYATAFASILEDKIKLRFIEEKLSNNPKTTEDTRKLVEELAEEEKIKTEGDLQFAKDLFLEEVAKKKLQTLLSEAFHQPISEKFSISKQMLERFAFRWRYKFFAVGLILFLASLLPLNLAQ